MQGECEIVIDNNACPIEVTAIHSEAQPQEGAAGNSGVEGELPNLDLLRVWAVLLVLLSHLQFLFQLEDLPGPFNFRGMGHWGVLMFFVHTSLVLTMSLQRQYRRLPTAGLFVPFMIRRIFRIYPLSMFCVAMVWLFNLPLGHIVHGAMVPVALNKFGWLSNFLLLQNLTHHDSPNVPMWSLPYEMQMYLFLPALFLLARWKWGIAPLLGLWWVSFVSTHHEPALVRHHLPDFLEYVACFVPGVIAYKMMTLLRPRLPAWMWLVVLPAMSMYYLRSQSMSRGAVACLLLGGLIPLFAQIPFSKFLQLAARYSYGIYLAQFFCIWLGFKAAPGLPWAAKWSLFLVLLTVIPVALYHLLERPMIDLGHKLARRRQVSWPPEIIGSPKNVPNELAVGDARSRLESY
jgi:peptidoglycan/LPS O-acetylase OafA/YrhL